MSGSVAEVPVLIVGGGPCGLAASLTLSRLGVEHLLVERNATPLHHPKAVGVMQRTAELLRGWGAEEEMRARGVPAEFSGQMWCGRRRSRARSSAAPSRRTRTPAFLIHQLTTRPFGARST